MRLPFALSFTQALGGLADQYRLQTGDMDLLRAQFREFIYQIPLLYLILSCNAAALAISFFDLDNPLLSALFPLILCTISAVRGIWWMRRRNADFTDEQICRHIRTTSRLAIVVSIAFMLWGLALYPYGDDVMQGHLVFFLAITQIACVFLLMPVRSASLAVATIGIVPFTLYFLIADNGKMWVEAVTQALAGFGMVYTLTRYNGSFAQLIQSQISLRRQHAETKQLSDENRRIAFTDPLSGLPNRRALLARLEEIHLGQTRGADQIAIIFVDLDGFKTINDTHGHQFGDALIIEVGRRLTALRPDEALLARMGGDEFAILLDCVNAPARAQHLAEQMLDQLSYPFPIDGKRFQIGASIGIAIDRTGDTSSYELMRQADTAMYRVKENGKGGIQLYDASFDADRLWRQQIEQEIANGLDKGEFTVFYQPLVDARTGACVAAEALIRWPGRAAGALMPDDFIEIAETGNLIQQLGIFVLRRACIELKNLPDFQLSVNISPAQFRYPEFEADVMQVLRETGFPPHQLQLEITEKYLIDHPERARKAIDSLKKLGIRFALDDFGTGFTSIAYLQSYGFDCIKIDKSLSEKLTQDPKASLLISGMVFMANGLDMRVVAEGVENEQQAKMLRMAGCQILQGFLFGKPGPVTDLTAYLDHPSIQNGGMDGGWQGLSAPQRLRTGSFQTGF